ncbi:MAG: hypothetical protein LUC43_10090, partial [Burkholderiales bacterium]|nr:hypothetical protein [Burkholderiales bacterium]
IITTKKKTVVKMKFNFRKSALLILATLFPVVSLNAIPTTPDMHLPPESKAIFGIVVLGKTTLDEFAQAIETLGCALDEEKDSVSVNSDCLNVAGNPKILVFDNPTLPKSTPGKGIIECVSMEFNDKFPWEEYFVGLRELWGYPSIYRVMEGAPEKLSLWRRKGIVISLTSKKEGPTLLTYSTPARVDRIWQEKKKASHRSSKIASTP